MKLKYDSECGVCFDTVPAGSDAPLAKYGRSWISCCAKHQSALVSSGLSLPRFLDAIYAVREDHVEGPGHADHEDYRVAELIGEGLSGE